MSNKKEALERVRQAFSLGNSVVCMTIWQPGDAVQSARDHGETLTQEEAENVIQMVEWQDDATAGINWDTIWIYVQEVIGDREENGNIILTPV
jgi:hypothetical protein